MIGRHRIKQNLSYFKFKKILQIQPNGFLLNFSRCATSISKTHLQDSLQTKQH